MKGALVQGLLALAALAFAPMASAQTKLEFMTEWAPHGFHAPFYLAQGKGWFKDAGLEVNIRDGRGSGASTALLAAGQVEITYGHFSAAATGRSKGLPVKVVASVIRKNSIGLVFPKGQAITTPQQLKGKTILYAATTFEGPLLQGVLASNGLPPDTVKALVVDASSKVASVLGGRGDAAMGPVPYYLALAEGKQELGGVSFADFGLPMLDMSIFASEKSLKEKPDAIKSFVAVMSRAFEYTQKSPANLDEALKAMIALRPNAGLDMDGSRNMYRFHAQYIASPSTEGKPIGYVSLQEIRDSIKTLRETKVLEADVAAEDLLAPGFAPQ